MREILFRGKRMDNGEWVEGFLVVGTDRINNGKCYILPGISDFSYGDNGNRIRIGCFVEVDPETIGQFTGLTDKNGKKIFEGDIMKGPCGIRQIVFEDGSFCLRKQNAICMAEMRTFAFEISTEREVIGNIHDNPELIGGAGNGT